MQDAGFDEHAHAMHEAGEDSAHEAEVPFATHPNLNSDVLADASHAGCESDAVTDDRRRPAPSDPAPITGTSVFTISPECPAYDLIAGEFEHRGIDDLNVNLSDIEQSGSFCGDTAFTQSLSKVKKIINDARTMAGIMIHPGMLENAPAPAHGEADANSCPSREQWIKLKSQAKESNRSMAAILVRMLTVLALLLNSGKQLMLMVPWPAGSEESVMKSKLMDETTKRRLKSVRYAVHPWADDATYEVITNSGVFNNEVSLEDAIKKFIEDAAMESKPDDVDTHVHPQAAPALTPPRGSYHCTVAAI